MARTGGGRSSGGGGGRSFGGRSGGSIGGRAGGSFGGRSGGSSGGFGSSRPSGNYRPVIGGGLRGFGGLPTFGQMPINIPSIKRQTTGGNNNGGNNSGNNGGNNGTGCSLSITAVIIILLIFLVIFSACSVNFVTGMADNQEITKSTIKREPLEGGVIETAYYTDNFSWIIDESDVLPGLKKFYEKTGVQPHVYITDNINNIANPSDAQINEFAVNLYDQLFKDEAHFLLVFYLDLQNESYTTWYVCGSQAKAVIDDEAADIILDYLDKYYYYESLSEEEYLSKSFGDAADRIMDVTVSPWVYVWITLGIVVVALLAFSWWNKAKEQKNKEDEAVRKILETPLETFGETKTDTSALEEKYKDK